MNAIADILTQKELSRTAPYIMPDNTAREASNTMPLSLDELCNQAWMRARKLCPGFILDDSNRQQFRLLVAYFNAHPSFEEAGYSLRKGIYLCGGIGTGKTTLMRIFEYDGRLTQNFPRGFRTISCRDVVRKFAGEGYKAIEVFGKSSFATRTTGYGNALDMNRPVHRCFDDLGLEGNARFFGNDCNVMAEIMLDRYDMYMKHGMLTHLTTNIGNGEQIEGLYGDRVRSRMREMFNMIELPGNDRRH